MIQWIIIYQEIIIEIEDFNLFKLRQDSHAKQKNITQKDALKYLIAIYFILGNFCNRSHSTYNPGQIYIFNQFSNIPIYIHLNI